MANWLSYLKEETDRFQQKTIGLLGFFPAGKMFITGQIEETRDSKLPIL